LACESLEDCVGRGYASEVDQSQHSGQRAVDAGAVYESVYLVEAVAQDGYAHGGRDSLQDNQNGDCDS
jgi:hypothetical protein